MDILKLGKKGEKLAVKFLKKNGYKILETNYRIKSGEIDVIAELKNKVCFVEVKTRESGEFMKPHLNVNEEKQRRIKLVAMQYITSNSKQSYIARFDIIEVIGGEINHLENAYNPFNK